MAKSCIILMADYGHDPTEVSIPYQAFKRAGFELKVATENGKSPECDKVLLTGLTQKLLGANQKAIKAYNDMKADETLKRPLSWTDPNFSLENYDLIFLPGGHEGRGETQGVRQLIDSTILHKQLATYFPQTERINGRKTVGAVCHGVMLLSATSQTNGEKSIISESEITALPALFENFAYWSTRLFLGDYYCTYGKNADTVQASITKRLSKPEQFKNSLGSKPFVVEDTKYRLITGRFPPDADLLAERLISLVNQK